LRHEPRGLRVAGRRHSHGEAIMLRSHNAWIVLCALGGLTACNEQTLPLATAASDLGPAYAQLPGGPIVNSLADPGDGICDDAECTLREAIAFASSGATITFSVNGVILLQDSIVIDRDLTIDGPGPSSLTVARPQTADTPEFRFLVVSGGTTVSLADLTATGFQVTSPSSQGSVIRNVGTLIVENVVLTGNSARFGGTIYSLGVLLVSDSRISDNAGSGLANDFGDMTVRRTIISRNQMPHLPGGGGILNAGVAVVEHSQIVGNSGHHGGGVLNLGSMTITNTTITGNTAAGGGGVWQIGGSTTITSSTVSNNMAQNGGGVGAINSIQLTVEQSTVTGNSATQGGGFHLELSTFAMNRTLVSGNSASEGGGLYCSTCAFVVHQLTNSSFTSNSATISGGAYLLTGHENLIVSMSHVSFYGNTAPAGSAIHLKPLPGFALRATARLRNTVIASANSAVNCLKDDVPGIPVQIVDQGNNIDSGTSCGFTHADSKSSTDPMLDPLADNGGPTWTHALRPGSAAIDGGTCLDNDGNAVLVDQRGIARPRGAACDIGAFETSVYAFTGFLAPVNNLPTVNRAKAGSAVPIKFSLGGNFGLDILAPGSPSSQNVPCDAGAGSDPVEAVSGAGGSGLTYDALSDQYTYVWKTDKAWANTCRTFELVLEDGTTHMAAFNFAR
jgi:CSLREA domain-containing protein